MAAHDFRHLCSVRRTTGRCVDDFGSLPEILGAYRRGRDHAKRLRVLDSVVIEPVNGASGNAKCLPRPDVNLFPVDSPGRHSVDAVDRLFIMVVAMGRGRQALRGPGPASLKGRNAATRSSLR